MSDDIDTLANKLNMRFEAFEELLVERFDVGAQIVVTPDPESRAKLTGLSWRRASGGWGLDALYEHEQKPIQNATLADRIVAAGVLSMLWEALENNTARRIGDLERAISTIDLLLTKKKAKRSSRGAS